MALGWPLERIHTIDSDLGRSGADAAGCDGFQHLVSKVAMGEVGIVLGLEVSRLARNNADWHRLIELAAFSETLILDEDGVYDPVHFNDRLLLGLKGTMSEAERRCSCNSASFSQAEWAKVGMAFPDQGEHALAHRWSYRVAWPLASPGGLTPGPSSRSTVATYQAPDLPSAQTQLPRCLALAQPFVYRRLNDRYAIQFFLAQNNVLFCHTPSNVQKRTLLLWTDISEPMRDFEIFLR